MASGREECEAEGQRWWKATALQGSILWGILWGPSMAYSLVNQKVSFEMCLIYSRIQRLAFNLLNLCRLLRRQPLYPSELQAHSYVCLQVYIVKGSSGKLSLMTRPRAFLRLVICCTSLCSVSGLRTGKM